MSDYVRVSINQNELKKAVSEVIGRKVLPLSKDKQLRTDLARVYGELVTDYVPRSNLPVTQHHLQTFSVSDGRVRWHRTNSKGEEIASRIFNGETKGTFHSRYGGHMPETEWTKELQPGTALWDKFVDIAALMIKEKGHFK